MAQPLPPLSPPPLPSGGWTPVPDPTELTARAVLQAKEDMRRELEFAQRIIMQRIDAMDIATKLLQEWRETLPRRLADAIEAHASIMTERFLRVDERFATIMEKFESITTQFQLRDKQVTEASIATKTAIDAALQAQEKAVGKQNESFSLATQKSEDSFTKQIGALDSKIGLITEQLKGSMSRGEVQQLVGAIVDKIDGPTGLAMRLENAIARSTGRDDSSLRSTTNNQWAIGAILGGVALLVAFITLAMKWQGQ